MEIKKSQKANLENKRGLFLKIGLSIILILALLSFNYKSNDVKTNTLQGTIIGELDEDDIIVTRRKEIIPPKPKVVEQIKIVDNTTIIDEDIIIPDVEDFDSIPIDVKFDDEKIIDTFEPYMVEESADFIGGIENLNKFLEKNIKYPAICKENQIEGKVILKFIVDKSGKVIDIDVVKHADKNLEEEAIRVLSKSPKWKPAKQNGRIVSMYFYLPINFELN